MNRRAQADMVAAILGAAAIVTVAMCVGLIANHVSATPLPLFASAETLRAPVPTGVSYISLQEALARLHEPGVLVVDGRPAEAYAAGHLPGARSLPVEDFARASRALRGELRQADALLCYCDALNCEEAAQLTRGLKTAGYRRIALIFEGWDGWLQAGYPIEKAR